MGYSLAQQFCAQAEGLPCRELAALEYDFSFWGRPEQQVPTGHWLLWLILAGRGWGKTRTGAEAVRHAVCNEGVKRIALVGATAADVRDVMLFGPSGLLNIFPEHQRPKPELSRRRVLFHTGAVATLYSAETPRRLRGPQHEFAWLDELAAWENLEETLYNLDFGLRLGERPRKIVTTTPLPLDVLKEWVEQWQQGDESIRVTRGSTYDNAENLSGDYFRKIIKAYEGTRLGRQELLGEILGPESGLFQEQWLRYNPEPPRLSRIVVGVDPAISVRNDETGIVVAGRAGDNAYVLEDLSGRWSPEEWARKACDAVARWRRLCPSVRIVAEVNRGGDLVRSTIRQFDRVVPIDEVRATRGKDTRAQPIAALYEQKRVFHVERFRELEKQMLAFDPTSQEAARRARQATSPDRLDALVWAITQLGFHVGVATFKPRNVEFPSHF